MTCICNCIQGEKTKCICLYISIYASHSGRGRQGNMDPEPTCPFFNFPRESDRIDGEGILVNSGCYISRSEQYQ